MRNAFLLSCLLLIGCSSKNHTTKHYAITRFMVAEHECVDMGGSVLWATENISDEYFAWGETSTKQLYLPTTYDYQNDSLGEISKTTKDIVSQKWGAEWRMPTYEEFEELISTSTLSWKGNGYMVKGVSGDSIFFPTNGYMYADTLKRKDSEGYYWTASQNKWYKDYAWRFCFVSDFYEVNDGVRYYGFQIRGVTDKKK